MKQQTLSPNWEQTFQHWLLAQRHRQDPVGDLERDFRQDLKDGRTEDEPPSPKRITPGALRAYLQSRGASEGAREALARAAREFGWRGRGSSAR